MTAPEDQAWADLGVLIGIVVAEVRQDKATIASQVEQLTAAAELIAELQGQLEGAEAEKAAAVAQGIADALAVDTAADTERTLAAIERLAEAAPVTVPDVPTPDPGEPAEPTE
ncbi:MAG TPA: hypothetical protein VK735_44955 [Pseudonocardia sp.]|uniref:hypothetical protein n=1 Tax=Pseudonocardia sp. TaxID=60912 RepID=UPI002B694E62|nr:hypothetical protein [Pseudonocardia sp.]HTF54637.1 hypothetical protein [Pseudonocardia sp.]